MNTVTGCLNAGNFSQAQSVADALGIWETMTPLIADCQTKSLALAASVQAALAGANGQ